MIYLTKNKAKFDVVVTADNGEVLHHSGQGFERKAGAHNHINSLAEQMGNNEGINFQDDTGDKPIIMYINENEDVFPTIAKPGPRYVAKRAR